MFNFWGTAKVLAVFATLGLAGCVAPPIVTYASLALDGASYLTTGKSVGDHALSAAVNEDCALLRAVTEQNVAAVCHDYDSETERAEAVTPTVMSGFQSLFIEIEADKIPPPPAIQPASFVAETATNDAAPRASENRQAIYLMLGNFPSMDGAEALAARVTGLKAVVAPAWAGDAGYFRVVAGPIAPGEANAAQSRLAAAGIGNSWAARLCTRNLGAPPCINPD